MFNVIWYLRIVDTVPVYQPNWQKSIFYEDKIAIKLFHDEEGWVWINYTEIFFTVVKLRHDINQKVDKTGLRLIARVEMIYFKIS